MSSTNTQAFPPACENCGRHKSVTYICNPCVDKLNVSTRALIAERDELQQRLDKIKHRLRDRSDMPLIFVDSNDLIAIAEGKL